MEDAYAQQLFGTKAAQVQTQLLESIDPCKLLRDELNLDTCLADRTQIYREFRCIHFPLFASGGPLLPRKPPAEEHERVWATESPGWSAHVISCLFRSRGFQSKTRIGLLRLPRRW
eukprot:5995215-Pleurochrysis_carterae.AAC.1